jgi:hypothetical protein
MHYADVGARSVGVDVTLADAIALAPAEGGFVVRLGFGDVIIHHKYLKRDWRRMDFYVRRNDIPFAWRNIPMPYLPAHLLATTFNRLSCALRTKRSQA